MEARDAAEVTSVETSEALATSTSVARAMPGARPDEHSVEQIVARGRRLAGLAVEELIEEVHRRASAHQLDRGLRLSLPYFDDRRLTLRRRDFTVIPRGRVMFVPAFVVIAAEREVARVAKDAQYTETTRRHLLELLRALRAAFAGARVDQEDGYSS